MCPPLRAKWRVNANCTWFMTQHVQPQSSLHINTYTTTQTRWFFLNPNPSSQSLASMSVRGCPKGALIEFLLTKHLLIQALLLQLLLLLPRLFSCREKLIGGSVCFKEVLGLSIPFMLLSQRNRSESFTIHQNRLTAFCKKP